MPEHPSSPSYTSAGFVRRNWRIKWWETPYPYLHRYLHLLSQRPESRGCFQATSSHSGVAPVLCSMPPPFPQPSQSTLPLLSVPKGAQIWGLHLPPPSQTPTPAAPQAGEAHKEKAMGERRKEDENIWDRRRWAEGGEAACQQAWEFIPTSSWALANPKASHSQPGSPGRSIPSFAKPTGRTWSLPFPRPPAAPEQREIRNRLPKRPTPLPSTSTACRGYGDGVGPCGVPPEGESPPKLPGERRAEAERHRAGLIHHPQRGEGTRTHSGTCSGAGTPPGPSVAAGGCRQRLPARAVCGRREENGNIWKWPANERRSQLMRKYELGSLGSNRISAARAPSGRPCPPALPSARRPRGSFQGWGGSQAPQKGRKVIFRPQKEVLQPLWGCKAKQGGQFARPHL